MIDKNTVAIFRDDSGRAIGTRVVVWATYTELATRRVKKRVVDVVVFRGHMHKVRARDFAAGVRY